MLGTNNLSQPSVSVVIPVFNDSARLQKCLLALENQSYPSSLYEVLVIDNDSTEDIKRVVDCFTKTKIFLETAVGSYAARNKGIEVAKGDLIAFTDADCIPAKQWIEQGVKSFLAISDCGLVGGKIELFFEKPAVPTAVELYESVEMNFHQDILLSEQNYALTANMFTSKQVIVSVGLFNKFLKSGGDREWGQRVFAAGYKQAYASEALVQHPARRSFWQLYKRVTRINGGNLDAQRSTLSEQNKWECLLKDFVLAFTPPGRSILSLWSDPSEQQSKLVTNKQKLQFVTASLFVRYVSAWERIRIRLGGKSRRW